MSRPCSIACAFPASGFAAAASVAPRPAPPCAVNESDAPATAKARMRIRFMALSWQRECEDVAARCNRDVLLAVDRVADRRRRDQIAGVEMPERLAGSGVERADLSFVLAGEHQPAGGRQDTRSVVKRADLLIVPDLFPGGGVQRANVQLPRLFRLRTFEIAPARTGAIGRTHHETASFLRHEEEVIQVGVV